MEKVFWQVERLDKSCKYTNLSPTVEEASEEVLRALRAGFEVKVVKVMHTQEYYDSLGDFQDTGWSPTC